jgi:hypothetical protein
VIDANSALSILALIVSIVVAGFTAMQAVHGRRQINNQVTATELSFNLEVMVRLDTVLKDIAERPETYEHVWTPNPSERPPQNDCLGHVMTVSLIDAVELALQATERLPGFAVNEDDWNSYAGYVFQRSGAVRQEVGENPQWWPAMSRRLEAHVRESASNLAVYEVVKSPGSDLIPPTPAQSRVPVPTQ